MFFRVVCVLKLLIKKVSPVEGIQEHDIIYIYENNVLVFLLLNHKLEKSTENIVNSKKN